MNKLQKLEIKNNASAFRKDFGYGETDPIRLDSFLLKKNISYFVDGFNFYSCNEAKEE